METHCFLTNLILEMTSSLVIQCFKVTSSGGKTISRSVTEEYLKVATISLHLKYW